MFEMVGFFFLVELCVVRFCVWNMLSWLVIEGLICMIEGRKVFKFCESCFLMFIVLVVSMGIFGVIKRGELVYFWLLEFEMFLVLLGVC